MAFPTAVNSQITDAVTQSSVKVVAESPAMAMSVVYQAAAHSVSILFGNATSAQAQSVILAQAATTAGVNLLHTAANPPT